MTRERPKRLLMIVHSYYPDDPRVASEARVAVDAGFEVDVIALRRSTQVEAAVVDGVRVRRLSLQRRRGARLRGVLSEYGGFTVLAAVAAARQSARARYGVVHVHNPPDFLVLAALVPRLLGARILFDVHDLASDMFSMRYGGRPGARVAGRVLRLVERWSARAADAVLTVHEPYRNELMKRGVRGAEITVVMNVVDERLLPPPAAVEENGSFRVVYHGTVTPHYGVELVIDSAAALRASIPNLAVEIYGDGDAVAELRRKAHRLGVADIVRIDGRYLPRAEVLRAVQGASVGVIPNLPSRLNRFALSTKLFEYVALGIPVVSADLPTIQEHFSESEVRYFRAGDAASLTEALAEVAARPENARARAEAALRRYEDYRWSRSARRYLDVLERLTG